MRWTSLNATSCFSSTTVITAPRNAVTPLRK
jgi:hypothetical protein